MIDRRGFIGRFVGGVFSLLGLNQETGIYVPKSGDRVRIVSYPDNGTFLPPDCVGIVIGPKANPPVMNEHYLPDLQLWAVECGPLHLECYAHEIVLME